MQKGQSMPSPFLFKPADYVKELKKDGIAANPTTGVLSVVDQSKYAKALIGAVPSGPSTPKQKGAKK